MIPRSIATGLVLVLGAALGAAESEADPQVLQRLRDRAPAELRMVERPLSADENAWSWWGRMAIAPPAGPGYASLAKRALRSYQVGWSADERALAASWISERSEAIDLFVAGAAAPSCRLPAERLLGVDPLVTAMRTACRLLMFRSALRAEQGDLKGAIADSRTILTSGRHLMRADGSLMVWMVGISLEQIGYSCLARCIHHRRCVGDLLRVDVAGAFPEPAAATIPDALRAELWTLALPQLALLQQRQNASLADGAPIAPALVDAVQSIITSGAYDDPGSANRGISPASRAKFSAALDTVLARRRFALFDVDASLAALASLLAAARPRESDRTGAEEVRFRAAIDALGLEAASQTLDHLAGPGDSDQALDQAVQQLTNYFGRTIVSLSGGGAQAVFPTARACDAYRALVLAAAALRDGADQQRETWHEMAWGRDPFSGEALHLDAARQVLWSVWKNGKDDGGRDAPAETKGEDFVLSTELWGD